MHLAAVATDSGRSLQTGQILGLVIAGIAVGLRVRRRRCVDIERGDRVIVYFSFWQRSFPLNHEGHTPAAFVHHALLAAHRSIGGGQLRV